MKCTLLCLNSSLLPVVEVASNTLCWIMKLRHCVLQIVCDLTTSMSIVTLFTPLKVAALPKRVICFGTNPEINTNRGFQKLVGDSFLWHPFNNSARLNHLSQAAEVKFLEFFLISIFDEALSLLSSTLSTMFFTSRPHSHKKEMPHISNDSTALDSTNKGLAVGNEVSTSTMQCIA